MGLQYTTAGRRKGVIVVVVVVVVAVAVVVYHHHSISGEHKKVKNTKGKNILTGITTDMQPNKQLFKHQGIIKDIV